MASQKSTHIAGLAVAPKRQRGRDRVASILSAATEIFATRPYEAVTMTEVAARSDAAIGSLYRFFPTKEALADALIARYGAALSDNLDDLANEAAFRTPAVLADRLVDFILSTEERAAALALIEARSDSLAVRQAIRGAMRERLAAVLIAMGRPPVEARAKAMLLLGILKTVRALAHEDLDGDARAALVRESRRLVRLYLEDAAAAEG